MQSDRKPLVSRFFYLQWRKSYDAARRSSYSHGPDPVSSPSGRPRAAAGGERDRAGPLEVGGPGHARRGFSSYDVQWLGATDREGRERVLAAFRAERDQKRRHQRN
jgi:hypothetical protein